MVSTTALSNNATVSVMLDKPVIAASNNPTNFVISADKASMANYAKEGNDLVMQFRDGRAVRIKDFFLNDNYVIFSANGEHWLADMKDAVGKSKDSVDDDKVVYIPLDDDQEGVPLLAILAGLAGAGAAIVGALGGGDSKPDASPPENKDITPPLSPTFMVWDDVAPKIGEIKSGDMTNDPTPTFSGSGAEPGSKIIIAIDGGEPIVVPVDGSGNWSYTPDVSLDNGPHKIEVVAEDANGNKSDPTTIEFGVDTDAPDAPLYTIIDDDTPRSKTINPGESTSDSTPLIQGMAEPGATVTVSIDGGAPVTVVADKDGVWSCSCPELADGPHTVTVTQTDAAGNVSPETKTRFIVDTIAPDMPDVIVSNNVTDGDGNVITSARPIGDGATTNDNTPTISGEGSEPGSTIEIIVDGEVIATVTVDDDGKWEYTPDEPLPDGDHTIEVIEKDPAGNESDPKVIDITVDTEAPETPSIGGATDNQEPVTGPIANGGYTNDTQPEISGSGGEPGTTVTLYDGDTPIGSATVDENGDWTVKPEQPLADGEHDLTVTLTDDAGNESDPSTPIVINVDTVPPSGTIAITDVVDDMPLVTGTVADNGLTNDATPLIKGTSSEAAGTVVNVYDGEELLGSATVQSGGTWELQLGDSNKLAEGAHSFTATNVDAAGNEGTASDSWTVTIDTVPPSGTIAITDVVDDMPLVTGTVADNGLINDAMPLIQGSSSEADGSIVNVYDTVDGTTTLLGSAAVAGGTWELQLGDSNKLAEGAHAFTATNVDAAGNESAVSNTWNITVGTLPPSGTIAITELYDDMPLGIGAIASGGVSNDATLKISGTSGEQAGSVVRVYDGEELLGSTTVQTGGTWELQLGDSNKLAEGAHSFTATNVDAAGNEGTASDSWTVTIDTVPPSGTIAITAVVDDVQLTTGTVADNGYTNDTTPTVSGTGEAGTTVTLYDGDTPIGSATVDENGDWTVKPEQPLADGEHKFTVTLTGDAGNVSAPSAPYVINVDTTPPSAPAYTVTDAVDAGIGEINSGATTNDNTPTISGGDAEPGSTIEIIVDGEVIATVTVDEDGNWEYTPDKELEDGLHTISVTETDKAGNQSEPTTIEFSVDTTAPEGPDAIVTDDGGNVITDEQPTNDNTPTISGGDAEPGSTIEIKVDGDVVATVTVDEDGNWEYTSDEALEDGPHTISVTETDKAGNESEPTTISFSVDTDAPDTAPEITEVWDDVEFSTGTVANNGYTNNGYTNDATPKISGSSTEADGSIVNVYDGTTLLGTATVTGGAWSLQVLDAGKLIDGSHTFTAKNCDLAGNEGPVSNIWNIIVDTIAPDHTATTMSVSLLQDTWHGLPDGIGFANPTTATNTDLITRDRDTLILTGVLSKALAAGELLQVSKDGGTTWTTVLQNSGTNWSYDVVSGAVNEGSYTVGFRIVDQAGNIAATGNLTPKTIVADHTAPDDIAVAPAITETLVDGGSVKASGSGGKVGDYAALVQDANFDGVYEEGIDRILGWAKVTDPTGWSFDAKVASGLTNLGFITFDEAGNRSHLSPVTTVAVPESTSIMDMDWGSGDAGRDGRAQTGSMAISQTGGWLFFQPTANYGANLNTQQTSGWQNITTTALPAGRFDDGYGSTYTGSTFADLDRNGYVDMVNTPSEFDDDVFNVYWQVATGWRQSRIDAGDAVHMGATIAFDKEGDGYLDIVSADSQADSVTFIYNARGTLRSAIGDGDGDGAPRYRSSEDGSSSAIDDYDGNIKKGASTVDIDNDGFIDIAGHIGGGGEARMFQVYYNYRPNDQSFMLKNFGNVLRSDGGDPDYNDIEPKETWADFNGDGRMDVFLSRGAGITTTGTGHTTTNSEESRIYYNNGNAGLNTSAGTFTRFGDNHDGVLSFALDWNMDGKMDVVEMPKAQGASTIQLWANTSVGGDKATFEGSSLGTQAGVIGSMAADINWDGSVDLIMMTTGTAKVLLNPNVAKDGTSLHLRIVDEDGINIFYGNTVNLYDSQGHLVSTQMINPQGSATDSSGLVNFYGLDPDETYSVQLLRVTNGVKNHTGDGTDNGGYDEATVNQTWGGLKAGSAHDAFMLTAESTNNNSNSQQFGTGYNDTFFSSAGNDRFYGAGGWTEDFGNGSVWIANGGRDVVDYSWAAAAITANLIPGVATGDGTDTLVNIEGLIGSKFADTFTGKADADNFFDGRGGNDTYNLAAGGHDTLLFTLLNADDTTGGNGHDFANDFHIGDMKTDADADLIDLSQLFSKTANMPVASGYIDSDGVFKLDVSSDHEGVIGTGGINYYLRVTSNGTNTTVSVDLHGDGDSFAAILTLNNVNTTLEDLVKNHQIVV